MTLSNHVINRASVLAQALAKKFYFLQKNFNKMLFLLLFGFVTGNVFSSLVYTIQQFCIWNGSILIALILFMELISYLTYKTPNRPFLLFAIRSQKKEQIFWRFANMFKIGLTLGFFVDAFKLGS